MATLLLCWLQCRLGKLVEPIVEPGNQGFVDLSYTPDGALQPEQSRVWQFGLSLVQADGVGKTGAGACMAWVPGSHHLPQP